MVVDGVVHLVGREWRPEHAARINGPFHSVKSPMAPLHSCVVSRLDGTRGSQFVVSNQ